MNILLVNPPAIRKPDFPSIGLLSIATVLKQNGYTVKIVDAALDSLSNAAIVSIARSFQPDMIGMTTFIVNETQVLALARDLKQALSAPIILGGPHASSYPEELIKKEPALDGIVVKEGEVTVLELCRAIERGADWTPVMGLVFRNGKGGIVATPPRPYVKNMDDIPFPDRSFVKVDNYHPIPNMYKRKPATSVITARGCPFSCTYCFEAGVLAQKYRRRSPAKAVEEIQYLIRDYHIREIAFWDDEFVLNNKWVHTFCDLLRREKIDISWTCFGRVGNVNPSLLHKMAAAGCWSISYGVETGNQELLDFIKKQCTLDEIRDATRWTHEAGIETRCSFMLALPGETPAMGQKTIDFAIELDVDYAQFFATNPLPGTPLYENSHHLGRWIPDVTNYGFSRPMRAPFIPYAYQDEKQILDLVKEAHRRFYFRPGYFLKRLKRIRTFEDIKKYWEGVKMLRNL